MPVTNTYSVDLTPKATPVVVKVSQYDSGREITFNVKNNGTTFSLAGYSAAVIVNTRSTRVATMMCTVSGSAVRFSSTPASTLYSGRHMGELRITKTSGEYVGSCNFIWEVEPSPESDFIPSEDEENTFADMFQSAMQAAGQAQSYLQQMRDLLGNAQVAIENLGKRRYVFIGDSYGSGLGNNTSNTDSNWIDWCAQEALKIPVGEYYKNASDGAGFCNGTTFETLFNDISISDPLTITDIVVCGGWNDGSAGNMAVRSAMKSFVTTAKAKCPNATVHIGMISWCDSYRRYTNAGDRGYPTWNCRNALDAYRWAGAAGAAYIVNSEYVMHNMSYFQNDGLHPNTDGSKALGEHIATYLLGGGIDIFRYEKVGFSSNSSVVTKGIPEMYSLINNGQVSLIMSTDEGLHIDIVSQSIVCDGFLNGHGLTIGSFHDDHVSFRGGTFSEMSWYGPGYVRTGGTWRNITIMVRLGPAREGKSKELQVALFDTSGGFTTLSDVDAIWAPSPWLHMRAEAMMC